MNMFLEALEKILADHCTSADIRRVEAGGSGAVLWQQVEQAGFLDLLLAEGRGGAALVLPELFPVLECLGRFAVPVPLAQSIVARAVAGGATMPPVWWPWLLQCTTGPMATGRRAPRSRMA